MSSRLVKVSLWFLGLALATFGWVVFFEKANASWGDAVRAQFGQFWVWLTQG